MRSVTEIRAEMSKLDVIIDTGEEDEARAAQDALTWVLGLSEEAVSDQFS